MRHKEPARQAALSSAPRTAVAVDQSVVHDSGVDGTHVLRYTRVDLLNMPDAQYDRLFEDGLLPVVV